MAKKDTVGLLIQQKKVSTGELSIKTEKELFLMVDKGFADFDNDESEFVATEATELYLLTSKQLIYAKQLLSGPLYLECLRNDHACHVGTLISMGLAIKSVDVDGDMFVVATEQLRLAMCCWRAKKGDVK